MFLFSTKKSFYGKRESTIFFVLISVVILLLLLSFNFVFANGGAGGGSDGGSGAGDGDAAAEASSGSGSSSTAPGTGAAAENAGEIGGGDVIFSFSAFIGGIPEEFCGPNYGRTCFSRANSCNEKNRGTMQCNETCSARVPAERAGSCTGALPENSTRRAPSQKALTQPLRPAPTPPSPSLSSSNASIIGGNSATLTFSCVDSTSSSGVNFSTGGAPSGTVVVSPLVTTQFIVICSNGGQNFVNVNVFWPVLDISANPTRVKSGNVSLITWSTLGDDDILSCTVSGPNFFASGKSGSKTTAPITEESTYTLTCPTTENTMSESATVTLVPAFEEF